MKSILYTFLPMALAAALVLLGGTRLAKEKREERTTIDSERFTQFADTFQEERKRLEDLYHSHLENLTNIAISGKKDEVVTAMNGIAGVYLIRVFNPQGRDRAFSTTLNASVPEVELEGRKHPLSPSTAFILPNQLLETPIGAKANWLPETKQGYRVYITRPFEDSLVTILVDATEVQTRERNHFKQWTRELLIPIQGNNELLAVKQTDGTLAAASTTTLPDLPPSSFIPFRNSLGQWNIQTWDQVTATTHYNAGILSTAGLFSIILLGAGIILFIQQKHALRLAASRVSFVNRVSHELGTPLTSIRLNLDLTEEILDTEPQTAKRRLKLVSEEVDRLARLVTNVLTFARRERQTIEIKPTVCSPSEIITQTLKTFQPSLKRRGFEVQSIIPNTPSSLIDGDALAQITGNLISNVEKYANSGAWIKLSCEISDELLTLVIQDRGPGIPNHKKDQIFLPFERVRQDTSEGASGTGLGLSIARDLAREMGGQLNLLPSKHGAHFQLQIPCPPNLKIVQKGTPAA